MAKNGMERHVSPPRYHLFLDKRHAAGTVLATLRYFAEHETYTASSDFNHVLHIVAPRTWQTLEEESRSPKAIPYSIRRENPR
jgi:hypothetical protein